MQLLFRASLQQKLDAIWRWRLQELDTLSVNPDQHRIYRKNTINVKHASDFHVLRTQLTPPWHQGPLRHVKLDHF